MRERHAVTLQHVTFFEDATDAFALADAPTTRGARLRITDEFLAIHLFQAIDNQLLQFEQVFLDGFAVYFFRCEFVSYARMILPSDHARIVEGCLRFPTRPRSTHTCLPNNRWHSA